MNVSIYFNDLIFKVHFYLNFSFGQSLNLRFNMFNDIHSLKQQISALNFMFKHFFVFKADINADIVEDEIHILHISLHL